MATSKQQPKSIIRPNTMATKNCSITQITSKVYVQTTIDQRKQGRNEVVKELDATYMATQNIQNIGRLI